MKIQSIETFTHGTTVTIVRVKTDDGMEGYGQAAPFQADITTTVLHRQIAPHALGWDVAEVAAALDVPIAGGEQDNDLAQWRRMIAMDAVDIVQPDVCYLGGVTRTLRVAKMAEKAGKLCVPHSANRSMVTVFTLHIMGAIANAGPHVEFSIEPSQWTSALFTEPLEAVDGKVAIPEGPGWGVTVQPAWLEQAEYHVSENT